ncbi:hypothetical protein PybrP1_010854 [[Pythium] brassicae (nom. inval.)]|nr:hypothetical protein PybrP1_010854 [[Pythium] brassicae (nom. inval.)]
MAAPKQFDIVLYGATGYTGQLAARYLLTEAETAPGAAGALTWAMAGRSEAKLLQTKEALKLRLPHVRPEAIDAVPIVVAEASDAAAILALVQSTKVVLTLAGPYALYSDLLVQLCAEHGVHYCDITGEIIWVEKNARKYEAAAQRSGARIVHCCGLEAVPSDLTTFLLADFVRAQRQCETSHVSFYWVDSVGGVSGGTCASLINQMALASRGDVKRAFAPYFYTSAAYEHAKQPLAAANTPGFRVRYDPDLQAWTTVFIAAAVNSPVVLRSNYLLGDRYGKAFSYWERFSTGGFVFQNVVSLVTMALLALAYFNFTRALLAKLVPAPGVGPAEEDLPKGYFKTEALAYDADRKLAARCATSGEGDPAYLLTSKMIVEMAKCLAKGEHDGGLATGGFLTPATAGGHSFVKRLQDKGLLKFTITKAE